MDEIIPVDALAETVKRLAGELNAAIGQAVVAGIIVNVTVKEAEARGVGPTIEVELLKRL
jgi:hypothetical protein